MVTVSNLYTWNVMPGLRFALYSITMDSSYVGTAGETVTMATEFPNEVFGADVISYQATTLSQSFLPQYNRAASGACSSGTVKLYRGTSAHKIFGQLTTTKSAASINFYLLAYGR